ncbi:hypothetical protein ATE90_0876 [Polaribacter sp. Hel1_33_96]|jgi:hypothetical protein|uniref:hypothetical protein n=1 Tax=Polaribacter sp. Hel1_33_96 TaxID=1336805 RepID=UPI000C700089|nr:hypothetical protein [Polaribacter sp. Hel1_33_96]PKV64486.1 hypothetical protein ATE90_0876 [Polaribacter sp. Hel1_33_96]
MTLNFQQQINEMTEKAITEFKNAELKELTNENRLSAIGNIYFLFSNKKLKYIGQRQSKGIKTRLDQHLFGKSYSVDENGKQNGTISKWHLVKQELDDGNEISFKTILIEPDNLRTTIELEMIKKLNPEWNIQGK